MITIYRKDGRITKIEANKTGRCAILGEYSDLMQRLEKANMFFEDEKRPASEKEKQVSNLQKLYSEISVILPLLKHIGEDWETHKWFE